MTKWNGSAQLWIETCFKCDVRFGMPDGTYQTNIAQKEKGGFFCPHGHSQVYVTGETEVTKLRRERDRLKQRIAYKDDAVREAEARAENEKRRASGFKGQVTRIKNRVSAGVCPCCNRTFENLARHMNSQHPKFDCVEE